MNQQQAVHKASAVMQQVALLTGSRTVVNTGFRMVYPLLPVFARSVGVEITTFAVILMLTQLLGLTAPFIGAFSEQRGRRFTILLGLMVFAGGMLAVYISPDFKGLAAALLLGALGKMAFDPAVQAYVGDRVPYARRGLAMGVIELAWSAAFLIGVPFMTWLIARYDWRAPFGMLAILGAVSIIPAILFLEADRPEVANRLSFKKAFTGALNSKPAVAGLVLAFSISGANQLVNVVFGTWIEVSFGVMLSALAAASAVIGIAELAGEGIVVGFADRFGKRQLVIMGVAVNIVACLLLPLTGSSLNLALAGLFFYFLSFELSLVATIPLASELSPDARAMYMTLLVAGFTFGRAVVTPLAPILFESGLLANCLAAVALDLVALIAATRFIRID